MKKITVNFDKMEILSSNILIDTGLKKNIVFRSILPILANYKLTSILLDEMEKLIKDNNLYFDYIAGQQSRGFLFIGLCQRFKCGFIPITKSMYSSDDIGSDPYEKEYVSEKEEKLYINPNLFPLNSRFLIIDDLIATGGTMKCAINLIEKIGSNVVGCFAPIRLYGLELVYDENVYKTYSLLDYQYDEIGNNRLNKVYKKKLDYVENPHFSNINRIIFSIPTYSSKNLAEQLIVEHSRMGFVKWDKFEDETFHVDIENTLNIENKDIDIVFDLTSSEYPLDIQIALMIVIQRKGIRSLNIHIPFFNVGTMERFARDGEIATAETVLKIITRNFEKPNTKIIFYDVHALVTGFLTDSSKCDFIYRTSIDNLKKFINHNTIIVYPDDGASKRYGNMFEGRSIVLSKTRNGDKRIMSVKSFNRFPKNNIILPETAELIIVDDLCQSGNTLIECINYLKNLGYINISCYVTHGVFPNDSWRKFLNIGLRNFYVTKTIEQKHSFIAPFVNIPIINNNVLKKTKIAVASHNQNKLDAAYNFFTKKGFNPEIYGLNVDSNVSNQPIGVIETYTGAFNRIKNMKEHIKDDLDYLISFENGIIIQDNKVVDFCACILMNLKANKLLTCIYNFDDIELLKLLKDFIIYKRGEHLFCHINIPNVCFSENQTIADIVEEYYGYDKNNWHQNFNELRMNRIELMSEIPINFYAGQLSYLPQDRIDCLNFVYF